MSSNNKRRVVITGMGVVSPIGSSLSQFWQSLSEGKSGVGKVTQCDASDIPSRIAGEVKDFDPLQWFPNKKEVRKTDRFIQFAIAAAKMAIDDASLQIDDTNSERTGVVIGSGVGGLTSIYEQITLLNEKGPRRVSPFFIPKAIINLAAGNVAIRFGAKGPLTALATACASGNHALGDAFRLVQNGYADCMIAGGAEASINRIALAGFCSMRALSTRNDTPEKASRPFDKDRDGFVISEGAGILILEEREAAIQRGVCHIYGEIVGYGLSADAYHIAAPSEDGDGPARAMIAAINDAGIDKTQIDYINAHGTSTQMNDKVETLAIKKAFGEHAYSLKISSTKSMTGHLLGGAGGIEAVATALSLQHNLIPPTINLDVPEEDLDLNYVPHKALPANLNYAMSNSFGFGGTNACIIFKKVNQLQ